MNAAVMAALGGVVLVSGAWCLLHVDRKFRARGYLLMALGNMLAVVGCVAIHQTVTASVNTAVAAIALWLWWNNGGGDGMRRRFKAWVSSLGPRTAPQGA